MVPDAAEAVRGVALAPRWLGLLLACGLLLALPACGGSGSRDGTRRTQARPADATTVRAANCLYWRFASAPRRRALIAGLRAFFVQPLDTGARERVPPDAKVYKLLTNYCRLPFARAFLLYRLYGNAAAFGGSQ